MKNILVPTDFSECALNAIKFAADLSKRLDATVNVSHIHQRTIPSDTAFNLELDSKIAFKENEVFKAYIKELGKKDFMKGVKLKSSLDSVFELHEILAIDKYVDIDLIVMGAHVVDGVEEFFIGSNTQKFIQLAHSPVIVIKDEVKVSDINSIVFASDFKKEVRPKFEVIRKFADVVGAKLHYLKVMTPKDYSVEQEEMKDIADFVKSTGIDENEISLYQSVSIERGIIKYCKEAKADMLAIETHGKTGFSHLLQDNIAESLSNHMLIPLFSVKIEEERGMITDVIVDYLTEKNLFTKNESYG